MLRKRPVKQTDDRVYLFALLKLNFQQLMDSFLVVERIHYGQIDDPAQIDKVGFGTVFDPLFFRNG